MTRYLYSGPMQSLEIRVAKDAATEPDAATELVLVTFVPGRTVDLPDDHRVTLAMTAAGYLAPAPIGTALAIITSPPPGPADAGAIQE